MPNWNQPGDVLNLDEKEDRSVYAIISSTGDDWIIFDNISSSFEGFAFVVCSQSMKNSLHYPRTQTLFIISEDIIGWIYVGD